MIKNAKTDIQRHIGTKHVAVRKLNCKYKQNKCEKEELNKSNRIKLTNLTKEHREEILKSFNISENNYRSPGTMFSLWSV